MTKTELSSKSTANQICTFGWFIPVKPINNARLLHSKHFTWLPNFVCMCMFSNVKHRRQATQEFVAHGLPFVFDGIQSVFVVQKWVIFIYIRQQRMRFSLFLMRVTLQSFLLLTFLLLILFFLYSKRVMPTKIAQSYNITKLE